MGPTLSETEELTKQFAGVSQQFEGIKQVLKVFAKTLEEIRTETKATQELRVLLSEVSAASENLEEFRGLVAQARLANQGTQEVRRFLEDERTANRASRDELRALASETGKGDPDTKEQLRAILAGQQAINQRLVDLERKVGSSVAPMALAVGVNRVLLNTEMGYVLCAATDYQTIATFLQPGGPRPATVRLIQKLARPGDTLVEVAADLGLHTLAAARAMMGEGQVVVFEPAKDKREMQQETMALNGLSKLVTFHAAPVVAGASDAPVVTLDEALGGDAKVSILRIGEDADAAALVAGAKRTIEKNPDIALLVEVGSKQLIQANLSGEQWLAPFDGLELDYRTLNADTGKLESTDPDELTQNLVTTLFMAQPWAEEMWSKVK